MCAKVLYLFVVVLTCRRKQSNLTTALVVVVHLALHAIRECVSCDASSLGTFLSLVCPVGALRLVRLSTGNGECVIDKRDLSAIPQVFVMIHWKVSVGLVAATPLHFCQKDAVCQLMPFKRPVKSTILSICTVSVVHFSGPCSANRAACRWSRFSVEGSKVARNLQRIQELPPLGSSSEFPQTTNPQSNEDKQEPDRSRFSRVPESEQVPNPLQFATPNLQLLIVQTYWQRKCSQQASGDATHHKTTHTDSLPTIFFTIFQ